METFVPTRWDFEDLENKILDLINDKKKREEISLNGQENCRDIILEMEWKNFADGLKTNKTIIYFHSLFNMFEYYSLQNSS